MSFTASYGSMRGRLWTSPPAPPCPWPPPHPCLTHPTSLLTPSLPLLANTPHTSQTENSSNKKNSHPKQDPFSLSLCRFLFDQGLSGLALLLPLEGGWLGVAEHKMYTSVGCPQFRTAIGLGYMGFGHLCLQLRGKGNQ